MVLNVCDITASCRAWGALDIDAGTVTRVSKLLTLVVQTTGELRPDAVQDVQKCSRNLPATYFDMFRFHFLTRSFLYQLRKNIKMKALEQRLRINYAVCMNN
jgi:hypothetical protein